MTRKTYHISGTMTAVSPLTYTPPTTKNSNRNNGGIDKDKNHSLPTMNGTPFFSASGIRGKLRRLATGVCQQLLSESKGDEHKLTLENYFLATLGGIKQGKKEVAEGEKAEDAGVIDVSKLLYIRNHNPLLSLFGAMDPLTVPGKAEIGHAMCGKGDHTATIRYTRTNELIRNSEAWEMLDAGAYDSLVDMVVAGKGKTASKANIKALQAKLRGAEGEEKAKLLEEIAASKAKNDDDTTVNVMHPGLNYQVIVPGTEMDFRMTLNNVSDQEMSLFLHTLGAFGFYPVIGSHISHGCGRVALNLAVSTQDGFALKKIGDIKIAGDYSGMEMSEGVSALVTPIKLVPEAFDAEFIRKL